MNADGSEQTNLSQNPSRDILPSWSPDGAKIAFASDRDGNFEIYIMNIDGLEQTRLTNTSEQEISPVWSPDGNRIVYTSTCGESAKFQVVSIMDSDGSNKINLTECQNIALTPTWSPNGKEIAFSSDYQGNFDIYIVNENGSSLRNITNSPEEDIDPAWSPNGNQLVYTSRSSIGMMSQIYVINSDGSEKTLLIDNAQGYYVHPDWNEASSVILEKENVPTSNFVDVTYVVKEGDSLTRIGEIYGIPTSTIVTANQISTSNTLRTGQILIIPNVSTIDPVTGSILYFVEEGDTIYRIAMRYNVSLDDLVYYNELSNFNLEIGQKIKIPPNISNK